MSLKTATLALLALSASASLAQAAPATVSVWTGAPDGVNATTIANDAHKPTGLASAMFTYTGAINWFTPAGSTNTLGNFIGYGMGGVSNTSSPRGTYASVNDAMNAVLSTSGDSIDSYFQITTTYTDTSTQNLSISHDDGASAYLDGATLFDSSGETTAITNTATLAAGTHTLTIDYVEANGAPAVLNVMTSDVPEPGMIGVLGASLLAVGGLVRRRR